MDDRDPTTQSPPITRRELVSIGGTTLVAVTLAGTTGCASLMKAGVPIFPRAEPGPIRPASVAGTSVGTLNGGSKPIFVAPPGSRDPVAHSVADTLFWGDIMMEHAMFFAMLMPGAALASQRGQAEQFQQQFGAHLDRLRGGRLSAEDYAGFNNATVELTRRFIGYKQAMHDAQVGGRLHSHVWPSLFDHTRKEAERFVRRLDQLNRGNVSYERSEVIPFWADKMEEHSWFIAHMLDPDETVLKQVSETSAKTFAGLENQPGSKDAAMGAAQTIIDFKTFAGKGTQSGAVKSIIHPSLADHVRREAIRFKDELTRTG